MSAVSRIGKAPIAFDKSKVQVKVEPGCVLVQSGGKKMSVPYRSEVEVVVSEDSVQVRPCGASSEVRAFHGLYRSLIANAIEGVTQGFSKVLILNGVGYRASVSGKTLNLGLGYSHPVAHPIPEGIEVKVEKQTKVMISGMDKALVGQVAADVRAYRPVEPYLGKGVRYENEEVRRKSGKAGAK